MKTRITAEEVLTVMAYHLELFAMPTRHKYGTTYEQWLYQNGALRRIRYLEGQRLVAREHTDTGWVYRLTDLGSQAVRGRRDPEKQWQRPWDGWWRLLVFDLPVQQGHKRLRRSLLRWLRLNGFGYLQDSVWISPDPVGETAAALREFRDDAESVILMESRCLPGYADAALVQAAWPFARLQEDYATYDKFAVATLKKLRNQRPPPAELLTDLRQERQLWAATVAVDPLLPRALWPTGYPGPRVWNHRQELLGQLARHLAAA